MDKAQHKFLLSLTVIATILAFLVIMLGAYTRLKDGGLGCPDWPTCYGHVIVPTQQLVQQENNPHYAHIPVEPQKAWAEMVHRYFAGSVGLLVLLITIIAFQYYRSPGPLIYIPLIMVAVLIFQAILGMWTVTWLLYPLVVMGHLLGGMTLLSLLWLYVLFQTLVSYNPLPSLDLPEKYSKTLASRTELRLFRSGLLLGQSRKRILQISSFLLQYKHPIQRFI